MTINKDSIVGDLVTQNSRTALVFKKYKIDFCCNGGITLEQAAMKKGVNVNDLLSDLTDLSNIKESKSENFDHWPLDLLVDYIEKKHHRYVEENTPYIIQYLDKLQKVHGERHPELFEIYKEFKASSEALAAHMKKEELILFPYIRKMVAIQMHLVPETESHIKSIESPVAQMMHEHDTEGERFRRIESLTNYYTPPDNACNTYKVAFNLLNEFEDDLHQHIHLENNILFKKAMMMEKSFSN